jgi:hypothetical protein
VPITELEQSCILQVLPFMLILQRIINQLLRLLVDSRRYMLRSNPHPAPLSLFLVYFVSVHSLLTSIEIALEKDLASRCFFWYIADSAQNVHFLARAFWQVPYRGGRGTQETYIVIIGWKKARLRSWTLSTQSLNSFNLQIK